MQLLSNRLHSVLPFSPSDNLPLSNDTLNETGRSWSKQEKVGICDFELLKVLGSGAYGKVFLVRKKNGKDRRKLYAMKVLKKASIVQKQKTLEHTKTERKVLESIRSSPFLVSLHYAFQTDSKLFLVLGRYQARPVMSPSFSSCAITLPSRLVSPPCNSWRIFFSSILMAIPAFLNVEIMVNRLR